MSAEPSAGDVEKVAVAEQAAKAKYKKRKPVMYQGRVIYEWEQELDQVLLYIDPPPGVRAKHIECSIAQQHLKLGIKGNPPYIDEDLGGKVKVEESMWYMEDGVVVVDLQKATVGETWVCACVGQGGLDAVEAQQVQQKLMLERFQREHPGFDFSNAQFSGEAPDPTKFLGGVPRDAANG